MENQEMWTSKWRPGLICVGFFVGSASAQENKQPLSAGDWYAKAETYVKTRQLDDAKKALDFAIAGNPKAAKFRILRGWINATQGLHAIALVDLSEAIRLDAKDPEPLFERGWVYSMQGNDDRAIEDYSAALRLPANRPVVYAYRAASYRLSGDLAKAVADCDEALRLDPGCVQAWKERGSCYLVKGEHDRAIADLKKAIALDPADVECHLESGSAYFSKGDYRAAIHDLTKAKDLAVDVPFFQLGALLMRGAAYLKNADYQDALRDFEHIAAIEPRAAYFARYLCGWTYHEMGEIKKAIEEFTRAIQLEEEARRDGRGAAFKLEDKSLFFIKSLRGVAVPTNSELVFGRAVCYWDAKEFDKAIADFDTVLKVDANNSEVYYFRGVAYAAKKAWDSAIEDLSQAIRLSPQNSIFFAARSQAYAKKGMSAESNADLEKARQLAVPDK
jgi:tetratricopeptide (TPR) repeat protein